MGLSPEAESVLAICAEFPLKYFVFFKYFITFTCFTEECGGIVTGGRQGRIAPSP